MSVHVPTGRELGLTDCPTPRKKAYRSRAKAERSRRLIKNKPAHRHGHTAPYQCRCGMWHLTTDRSR